MKAAAPLSDNLQDVLNNRRGQLNLRIGVAALTAAFVWSFVGLLGIVAWLSIYALLQAVEWRFFKQMRSRWSALLLLNLNGWVFGSIALFGPFKDGAWGVAAGFALLCGCLLNAALTSQRSTSAYVATTAPFAVYLISLTVMSLMIGAPARYVALLGFADLMVIGASTVIWRSSAVALAAESTARARAEQADAAKSAFLAMMSHELRTPMNGVLGMAHALVATGLTERQAHYASTILLSGNGLMTLLNDILDLSKIEAGRFELSPAPTDLRHLVSSGCEIWRQNADDKGITLDWRVDDDVPAAVMADTARLRQMLLNLTSNAVKFTSAGGVTVRVSRAADTACGLSIAVTDTGAGIPEDVQPLLFQRFTQADASISRTYGGTGLGLAITRQIARLMDGDVSLVSAPGVGSTFTISLSLPEAPIETLKHDRVTVSAVAVEGALRILAADDNAANRAVLTALLEPAGVDLTLVTDGEAALAALRSETFDLVLMDVHMPVLDGLAATAAIREGRAGRNDIPVVALTADAMSGDRERFLALGFTEYLSKPIRPDALYAMLAGFVGEAVDEADQTAVA